MIYPADSTIHRLNNWGQVVRGRARKLNQYLLANSCKLPEEMSIIWRNKNAIARQDSSVSQIFKFIIFKREKILSDTNVKVSRQVKKEKNHFRSPFVAHLINYVELLFLRLNYR